MWLCASIMVETRLSKLTLVPVSTFVSTTCRALIGSVCGKYIAIIGAFSASGLLRATTEPHGEDDTG